MKRSSKKTSKKVFVHDAYVNGSSSYVVPSTPQAVNWGNQLVGGGVSAGDPYITYQFGSGPGLISGDEGLRWGPAINVIGVYFKMCFFLEKLSARVIGFPPDSYTVWYAIVVDTNYEYPPASFDDVFQTARDDATNIPAYFLKNDAKGRFEVLAEEHVTLDRFFACYPGTEGVDAVWASPSVHKWKEHYFKRKDLVRYGSLPWDASGTVEWAKKNTNGAFLQVFYRCWGDDALLNPRAYISCRTRYVLNSNN